MSESKQPNNPKLNKFVKMYLIKRELSQTDAWTLWEKLLSFCFAASRCSIIYPVFAWPLGRQPDYVIVSVWVPSINCRDLSAISACWSPFPWCYWFLRFSPVWCSIAWTRRIWSDYSCCFVQPFSGWVCALPFTSAPCSSGTRSIGKLSKITLPSACKLLSSIRLSQLDAWLFFIWWCAWDLCFFPGFVDTAFQVTSFRLITRSKYFYNGVMFILSVPYLFYLLDGAQLIFNFEVVFVFIGLEDP